MTKADLVRCLELAVEFQRRAGKCLDEHRKYSRVMNHEAHLIPGGRPAAALRRCSLELSMALAELRKP